MIVAIVPAYNEEKNIGPVISGLFNHVDKIIVVDDGSTDNTASAARNFGAFVLRHEINRGQGAALQTGHEYALKMGADYVIDFDADGQFDAEDIKPAIVELQKNKADVLFGSRFLGKKSNLPFLKRYFILPLARFFTGLFGGIWLSDSHNGFRILNHQALEKIRITQDRMAHNTEVPAQVKKCGLKYIEFPVKVKYSEYGQGIGGGVKVIRDLVIGKMVK